MGECDYTSISHERAPKVRNENEDFWRDPVDRCNPVPPGPNEVEYLESVLFDGVELEYNTNQS